MLDFKKFITAYPGGVEGLALKLGVSTVSIYRYLHHKRVPDRSTMSLLLKEAGKYPVDGEVFTADWFYQSTKIVTNEAA